MIKIIEPDKSDLDRFFEYLNRHLSENGIGGTPLFQPLSKAQSKLSPAWRAAFENALAKNAGEAGSRKLWVALNENQEIAGHIDIRFYNEPNIQHRVLLGMGVDSKYRRMKIGQQLLDFIIQYCLRQREIGWIDLQVLANNKPAISLYQKAGFYAVSTAVDMYRIDGVSCNYTFMTLNLENLRAGNV